MAFLFAASKVKTHGEGSHLVLVVGNPPLCSLAPPAFRASTVVHWVMDLYPDALLAVPNRRAWGARAAAPLLRLGLDAAFRRAHSVVAISPRMADRLRSRVGDVPVHAIPLWSQVETFPDSDAAHAARQRMGIDPRAFVVLYHGNLGLSYDFAPLLSAADILKGDRSVLFYIVGGGSQRDELSRALESRALHNVRLADPVPRTQLSESVGIGDVHLVVADQSSDALAFPAKLLTGLASGRPTILVGDPKTEVGSLLTEWGAGVVARPLGVALAACVRTLRSARTAELTEMGASARRLYDARFARARALAAWDGVLTSCT